MTNQDAVNLLGLSGEITPEIVKLAYRRASMKFHPDRNPAGLVMMQAINAAYALISEFTGNLEPANGYDEMLNDAINAVVTCEGIIIEVCGNWVWLSGDTKTHKEIIKASGFKWGNVKKMWYFRPEEWKSSNRKNNSIDDIRSVHGSVKIETKKPCSVEA
jgi:hypothetical protein